MLRPRVILSGSVGVSGGGGVVCNGGGLVWLVHVVGGGGGVSGRVRRRGTGVVF